MKDKGIIYRKIVKAIAKGYAYFFLNQKKRKHQIVFLSCLAAVILAVIGSIIIPNIIKTEDPVQELKDNFVKLKKEDDSKSNLSDSENLEDRWDETIWKMEQDADEKLWYGDIYVDIAALKEVNSDIIGWIYFEAADISYPVLYSGEDSIYLYASYEGEHSNAGSIFLEGENTPDFSDKHMLIYGHNMRNNTMFGQLKLYKNETEYYQNHQYFQLIYMDNDTGKIIKERYHIFAFKDVSVTDDIYRVFSADYDDISDFVYNAVLKGNYLDNEESSHEENFDKVITLSTCSSDNDRFVISAAKCAECIIIDDY